MRQICEELGTRLVFQTGKTEITSIFAAAAALLLLSAGVLSLLWSNRLP